MSLSDWAKSGWLKPHAPTKAQVAAIFAKDILLYNGLYLFGSILENHAKRTRHKSPSTN